MPCWLALRRLLVLSAALGAVLSPCAEAQVSSQDAPAPRPARDLPVAVWVSAGLGGGQVRASRATGTTLSGTLRLSVSGGPYLVTYRDSDIAPFFAAGDEVRDRGVLFGARTSGRRAFFSGSLGYARAQSILHTCEGCRLATGEGGVVAYDLMAHANAILAGASVSVSGAFGPSHRAYHTLGLNLELGYFGR